jgi:uncharacterized hydrophobic protein (TIGR00341 family)
LIIEIDTEIPEIFSRTQVGLGDIGLALAAGTAGSLAFTTGLPAALIGVMVAVALLPPLIAVGLLSGAGHFEMAKSALLLFLTNLICVNLSGVATFLIQGIRPLTWWEAAKAKQSSRRAMFLWSVLLLALALLIIFSRHS